MKSIADLAGKAGQLTVGGPPEWKTRDTGIPGFKKIYGLEFKAFRPLDAGGPLTLAALKNGQIDAGDLFTTDPSIAANDLVALEDPKNMYAAQNVVPLITKSKSNPTIEGALNAVSAKLDTATLVGPPQGGRRGQEGRRRGGQGVPDQERPRLTSEPDLADLASGLHDPGQDEGRVWLPPEPHPAFRRDPPVRQSQIRRLGRRPSASPATSDPVISVVHKSAGGRCRPGIGETTDIRR